MSQLIDLINKSTLEELTEIVSADGVDPVVLKGKIEKALSEFNSKTSELISILKSLSPEAKEVCGFYEGKVVKCIKDCRGIFLKGDIVRIGTINGDMITINDLLTLNVYEASLHFK